MYYQLNSIKTEQLPIPISKIGMVTHSDYLNDGIDMSLKIDQFDIERTSLPIGHIIQPVYEIYHYSSPSNTTLIKGKYVGLYYAKHITTKKITLKKLYRINHPIVYGIDLKSHFDSWTIKTSEFYKRFPHIKIHKATEMVIEKDLKVIAVTNNLEFIGIYKLVDEKFDSSFKLIFDRQKLEVVDITDISKRVEYLQFNIINIGMFNGSGFTDFNVLAKEVDKKEILIKLDAFKESIKNSYLLNTHIVPIRTKNTSYDTRPTRNLGMLRGMYKVWEYNEFVRLAELSITTGLAGSVRTENGLASSFCYLGGFSYYLVTDDLNGVIGTVVFTNDDRKQDLQNFLEKTQGANKVLVVKNALDHDVSIEIDEVIYNHYNHIVILTKFGAKQDKNRNKLYEIAAKIDEYGRIVLPSLEFRNSGDNPVKTAERSKQFKYDEFEEDRRRAIVPVIRIEPKRKTNFLIYHGV